MPHLEEWFRVEPPALTPDIYVPFYDWILQEEPFSLWTSGDRKWQLRVVGSPGSGKSTLSVIALRHLRALYKQGIPLATIFVQQSVPSGNETTFVANMLESIRAQLESSLQKANHIVDSANEMVSTEHCKQELETRLADVRSSLHSWLQSNSPAFLLVDDLDQCGYGTALLVEKELAHLQKAGLRIMITSRVPYQRKNLKHTCDIDTCSSTGRRLAVWEVWKCRKCYDGKEEKNTVCTTCKGEGHTCQKCGQQAVLFEFCDLVEISLDDDVTEYMEDFVAWSMQMEHGDLQIGFSIESSCPDIDFPPLSALGRRLLANGTAASLVENIAQRAGSNISLAKMRLEDLHNEAQQVADRLPRSLVSLFDAQVVHVQSQPLGVASLGLKAILIGLLSPDSSFEAVKTELCSFVERSAGDDLTLDEVLHATRGLVTVKPIASEDMDGYHQDFYLYVTENYNMTLFEEKQAVQLRRISRSWTSLVSKQMTDKASYHIQEVPIEEEYADSEDEDSIGDILAAGKLLMASQRLITRPLMKRSTWS